jgi:hypothetical protein
VHRRGELLLREVQRVRGGQGGQQLALVGQVVQHHHLPLGPGRAELPAGGAVAQRDLQGDLGGGAGRTTHADPAAHQGAEHGEEPPGGVLDGGGVRAVRRHLGVAVEQGVARHGDVVEGQPPVVHPVEPGLGTVVGDGHPVAVPAVRVADGHQPGVHPVGPPAADQLGEHHRQPAVAGGVADVVLARAIVRGVQVEGLGGRVVGRGGAQVLHVGAVAGLGHGEAARHGHRDDVGDERGVVALGAQRLHGPAEQTPLHARLHHQGQVGEGQHLDGGDRPAEVPAAAVPGVEAEPGLTGGGEVVGQAGDPGAGGLGVLAVDRGPLLAGQHAAGLLAHVRPATVEDGLQRAGGGRVAVGAHRIDVTRQ